MEGWELRLFAFRGFKVRTVVNRYSPSTHDTGKYAVQVSTRNYILIYILSEYILLVYTIVYYLANTTLTSQYHFTSKYTIAYIMSRCMLYTKKRFETAAMMFGAWKAGSSGCSSFEVRTVVNMYFPSMHD